MAPGAFSGKTCSVTFTLFNYTPEDLNRYQRLVHDEVVDYVRFQQEVSPTTGRTHLQGWCHSKSARTFDTWVRKLRNPGIHIEKRRGSVADNEKYCSKDESRLGGTDSFADGQLPEQGARTDIRSITDLAMDSSIPWKEVARSDPETFIKYARGIRELRLSQLGRRSEPTRCFWFYGATGSGKSRLARQLTGDGGYWKRGSTKWFDGYDPCEHPDCIIDDFRASMVPFADLLALCDRNPFIVENKGSYFNFLGERIFFTSPRPPKASWKSITDENLDQFERRLSVIAQFLRHDGRMYIRVDYGHDAEELRVLPPWLKSFSDLDPDTQRLVLESENRSIGLGACDPAFEPEFRRLHGGENSLDAARRVRARIDSERSQEEGEPEPADDDFGF